MKTAVPILLTFHGVSGFGSPSSTFTRTLTMATSRRIDANLVMYEVSKDPPSNGSGKNSNPWSVLANTEKWISTILGKADASNPYTRKEVSYMCELSDDDALVVAGIWRRLRESREQGQMHGTTEEQRLVGKPTDYLPPTFRQTQVIVVPNDSSLNDFQVFNSLITKINNCRRNARDFVLDINLKKLDTKKGNEVGERDWSVSVNCAHLHPKFGELTMEEKLQEIKEEEAGEVDVHLEAYKKKRLLARRSPYPTICIEVRATPPSDFSAVGPPQSAMRKSPAAASAREEDSKVTSEDVQKLEALFGKSAVIPNQERTPKEEENAFYDAIGDVIEEIEPVVSPLHQSQNWIASYYEGFDIQKSTFTTTNCQEVDGGYEFVFNNIAMQVASQLKVSSQFLVFSNFMSSSATSFEKFAREVTALLHLMPSLKGNGVSISTLHPEHIDPNLRCPVPVLVMNWN